MSINETLNPPIEINDEAIRVLLIDDQLIVGKAVEAMIKSEGGIEFHFCQDPSAALATALSVKPTVILQDLVMPDVEGLTLVKYMRANAKLKDVPIVVLSSKEEAETKAEAFSVGANDYIVKLPDKLELLARIKYHSKGYINQLQRDKMYNALLASRQELASQLKSAAEYVVSLLPAKITEGPIVTDWKYVPSADLGGDSFGYHFIDDDHFAMYLLDVCDHGVGPALLSVSALNVLRSQSLAQTDFRKPDQVMIGLNSAFQMEQQNNLYFTIWYGVFRLSDRTLFYASAGHPPALLYNDTSNGDEIIQVNLIIGHLPDVPYKSGSIVLPEKSDLYVFSDGSYEIAIDEKSIWTLQGMKEYLIEKRKEGSNEIEALYEHILKMNNRDILDDDFSMMKIRL
mgnify:FL=1